MKDTQLMSCTLLVLSVTAGQEVHESTEESSLKTTTLYPITNKTIDSYRNYKNHTEARLENINTDLFKESGAKENRNEHDKSDEVQITTPIEEKVTRWKIDANYAPPKDEENNDVHTLVQDTESENSNGTDSKEQLSSEITKSNQDEETFKPSPHLGNFFDDENLNLFKFSTPETSMLTGKKPAIDFLRSKEFYMLNYKSPKDIYRDQLVTPYRYEGSHFLTTNNWKQTLHTKPTVESSVKIPAGGLYKHSNPFKEKPSLGDEDFAIGYNEDGSEKENPVKKRANPWKNLVQLVTAFLPIGLIISALTPSIITLHSTDNDPYLSRLSRRTDDGDNASVPYISERCRRRLLCEIHSEENYLRSQDKTRHVRKHCYKIRCEDPQTLRRVLAWLLAHRPAIPLSLHNAREPPHTDFADQLHIKKYYVRDGNMQTYL